MISVVTVTNKLNSIKNIYCNFKRQIYPNKELVIIINNNNINLDYYESVLKNKNIKDFQIFKLDDGITLGNCLNYSIDKMNGDYWAKFDDDDYYGKNYLIEASYFLKKTNAELIGKKSIILYDIGKNIKYDLNQSKNKFVDFIRGPTFFCHKNLLNQFKFDDLNCGEDTQFLKKIIKNKKKMYATSNNNFIHIRNSKYDNVSRLTVKDYLSCKYKILK